MITASHYLALSGILFSIGLVGLITRRNLLLILLCVELMLNAANLALVTGSAIHGDMSGQVTAFFVMVIAAVEVSIGLAIAILLFRKTDSADTCEVKWLKG